MLDLLFDLARRDVQPRWLAGLGGAVLAVAAVGVLLQLLAGELVRAVVPARGD